MGATIAAGMRMGLNRETAMRYAFLLTVPSLLIAIIVDVPRISTMQPLPIVAAFIASVLGGVLAIRWFMKVFAKIGLKPFAFYCFLATIAGLLASLARG